jgi:hypothetical protein
MVMSASHDDRATRRRVRGLNRLGSQPMIGIDVGAQTGDIATISPLFVQGGTRKTPQDTPKSSRTLRCPEAPADMGDALMVRYSDEAPIASINHIP